tara:strand:- start:40 stop:1239 length:1200 start_codon:yes stop_codon:yes gene_type:complete
MSIEKEIIGDATIYHGDCMEVLESLENIDSCVADPPYGLSFMGKQWDYDVPQKELWEKVYQSIKQGGNLLSFFGSRTYHRGVIPIEDAGFEIRDQLMWLYGSGFPKSHNIGKAVDKLQGNEREVVGVSENEKDFRDLGKNTKEIHGLDKLGVGVSASRKSIDITKGNSEWEGWGTALKPAHEPIVMARKPFKGTVAENVLEHGTGGINIDGCRVGDEILKEQKAGQAKLGTFERKNMITPNRVGRFPANVMHDGSDVVQEIFPNTKGAIRNPTGKKILNDEKGWNQNNMIDKTVRGFADEGTAARYFYCAKASKKDRDEGNEHPTVKPTELMRYLCRLVTPKGGVVLDPFMGSGSTGKGALLEGFRFIGIEMEREYFDISCARLEAVQKNMQVSLFDEH